MKSNDVVYNAVSAFLQVYGRDTANEDTIVATSRELGDCAGAGFKGVAKALLLNRATEQGECAAKVMAMLAYLRRNANPNSLAGAQISPTALWKAQHFDQKSHQGLPGVAMAFYDHLYGSLSSRCRPADVTQQTECSVPASAKV